MLLLKVGLFVVAVALAAVFVACLWWLCEDGSPEWFDGEEMSVEWQREHRVGWKR